MDPFAVPRATFELSMRLATLPLEIGAKMLGAGDGDERSDERPAGSTATRPRSTGSSRRSRSTGSRRQSSTRKRAGGQTTQGRRRTPSEAAKQTTRGEGASKSQRRSSQASSGRKAQSRTPASSKSEAQGPTAASSEREKQPRTVAASPQRAPATTPEPVTPSEAAVPTARIEPAPHHWMPTPADSRRSLNEKSLIVG